MINKNQYTVDSDKKVLHKIGKHWAVASTLMLGLAGGAIAAGTVNANADTTTNQPSNNSQTQTKTTTSNQTVTSNGVTVPSTNNNVKTQINNNLDKAYQANQQQDTQPIRNVKPTTKDIETQATQEHQALLNHGANHTNSAVAKPVSNVSSNAVQTSSISSKPKVLSLDSPNESTPSHTINGTNSNIINNSASNNQTSSVSSASAVSSKASSSATKPYNTPMFNSAYRSYMAQMSGTDAEVASANAGDTENNSDNINKKNKPLIKDIQDNDYFSGNVVKTGNDDGLNYKVWSNGGVEFTDGTANSNLSNFSNNNDISNTQAIKFDDDIDISNVINMYKMFSNCGNLESLNLGNNFNTSKVVNMSGMFRSDNLLQSLMLPNSFDTSNVTDMSYMFADDEALYSLTLPNSFNTSKVTEMGDMFHHDIYLQSLMLPSSFDTSNVTNMGGMFADDETLYSLTLPNSFNTSNVSYMSDMFAADRSLQSLTLPNSFDTSNVTDMTGMFWSDKSLQSLILPNSFNTSKVTEMDSMLGHDISLQSLTLPSSFNTSNISDTGMFHMFLNDDLRKLVIQSPRTKLHNDDLSAMYKLLPEKDINGNNYTLSIPNDFRQGNVGTFVRPANIPPTNTINYQYNGNTIATQQFSASSHENKAGNGYSDLDVNNTNDANIPSNYHLVNANNNFAYDGGTHNVPIKPDQVTDTINYMYNGQYLGGFNKSGNSSSAQGASDTSFTIGNTPSDLPANYHVVNPNQSFNYDGGTHTIQIAPNNVTDTINFVNQNNTNVGTTTATGAPNTKFTVTNVPKGYYLTNLSSDQLTYDGQPHTIHVVGEATHQKVRYIDITNGAQVATSGQFAYQYNNQNPIGPVVGSQDINNVGIVGQNDIFEPKPLMTLNSVSHQQFNKLGIVRKSMIILDYINNQSRHFINQVRLVNTVGSLCNIYQESYQHVPSGYTVDDSATFSGRTPKSVILPRHRLHFFIFVNKATAPKPKDNDNVYKILQVPAGYTLVNNENPFKLADNGIYNVAVKEKTASDTINYTDNGKIVSTTKINGHQSTNTDINTFTANNVPDGYHLANTNNQVSFDGNAHNVSVVGDMVGGTATINLIYKNGKRSYMRRAYVNLSSNIGDPDIVINPQTYDKQGYQISSASDWHIPFDYPTVYHYGHGDLSRYNREHTFIYQSSPIDIQIEYVDTQTGRPVENPDDLGQVANDGDTIDLEDANNSNGIVSIDGSNYRLNLPQGYHLAHNNNYIKVTANGTYVKRIVTLGGFRMVRMPLMKLTLGITPHFNKHNTEPTNISSSSVTPVKPSNASSVTPSSSNSAIPSSASPLQPSSASVVPSSVVPSFNDSTTYHVSSDNSIQPIIPSDNVIIPSHRNRNNTSKHSSYARNNHSSIVNGKTRKKLSKTENKPNMIKHNRRVNRNINVRLNHASNANVTSLVAERNAGRTSHTNARPVHVNVPKPTTANIQHNNSDKLPQTNEASNTSAIVAVMMLLTSISLAGVDLRRKRSI